MPTPAEALTPDSSPAEYREAVSACIQQLVSAEGVEQSQAAAICYSQAQKASGKVYPKRKGARITGGGIEEF